MYRTTRDYWVEFKCPKSSLRQRNIFPDQAKLAKQLMINIFLTYREGIIMRKEKKETERRATNISDFITTTNDASNSYTLKIDIQTNGQWQKTNSFYIVRYSNTIDQMWISLFQMRLGNLYSWDCSLFFIQCLSIGVFMLSKCRWYSFKWYKIHEIVCSIRWKHQKKRGISTEVLFVFFTKCNLALFLICFNFHLFV